MKYLQVSYLISTMAANATANVDTLLEMTFQLCDYILKQSFILCPGV